MCTVVVTKTVAQKCMPHCTQIIYVSVADIEHFLFEGKEAIVFSKFKETNI